MQTKSQIAAEKIGASVFVGGVVIMFSSLALTAITKKIGIGALVFVSVGWIVFAVMNAVTLYTGEFRWKSGPTFTRQKNPVLFYASWIIFTSGSMSISTFLLVKAIQENLK